MSEYIKKYNTGSLSIDLPFPNYIHELPLLTFGDIKGKINISLIHNHKSKLDDSANNENPFNIAYGYKLNIQKRIIFKEGIPLIYQDTDGTKIELFNYNGIYTFDDNSQRIIRLTSSGYELELSDLSKEIYNTSGYITAIYDKYGDIYLAYNYTNSLLTSIVYNNSKTVTFSYLSNKLSSINYASTTSSIVYSTNYITVSHYSGVTNTMTITNKDYLVEATAIENSTAVSYSKKCQFIDNNIILTDMIGSDEIDNITYTYPNYYPNDYRIYNLIEVTNKLGVKTRLQFTGRKLDYSYEIEDDAVFDEGYFTGDINIYNSNNATKNAKASGVIKRTDGVCMMQSDSSTKTWNLSASIGDEEQGYYLLTGWAKSLVSDPTGVENLIYISNTEIVINAVIDLDIDVSDTWHFFTYTFYFDANEIYVKPQSPNFLELKDLRLTSQKKYSTPNDDTTHAIITENVLLDLSYNRIPLKDVTFIYSDNGIDTQVFDVTTNDILRYKMRIKKYGSCNEIYYNNCKCVISTTDSLQVLYNGTWKLITNYFIGTSYYKSNKEHYTSIMIYETLPTSNIIIKKVIENTTISRQELDTNFDPINQMHDGVTTVYTRNKSLLLSESVENLYSKNYVYEANYITETNELNEVTTYYIDSTWGNVYKIVLPDGTHVLDTYDDDQSVLMQKQFGTAANSINNNFEYSKGNLSNLSTNNLDYNYTYTKGEVTQVKKMDNIILEQTHTDTNTTCYYPSQASNVYSVSYNYDKYNRLLNITNVLENTYDVYPTFPSGVLQVNFNNKDSFLATQKDLITGETSKYEYTDKGLLETKTITNDDTEEDVMIDTFSYDSEKRLDGYSCSYISSNVNMITESINYLTSTNDDYIDGRISENIWNINNAYCLITDYAYDTYKRITSKNYNLNDIESTKSKIFTKTVTFNNTRISNETSSASGTINYSYDNMGRIISKVQNNKTTSYQYDIYGRLIRENNQALDKTYVYEYNNIGNIVSKKEYSYSTLDTLPTSSVTKTYQYDTTHLDRLTSYNGLSITYNTLGCIASYNGYTYTWTNGKLTSRQKGNRVVGLEKNTFAYNAKGQRITKTYSKTAGTNGLTPIADGEVTSSTTTYYYDHFGRLVSEKISKVLYNIGTRIYEKQYLYDQNNVIGMVYTEDATKTTYYFERNILGDITSIYDIDGVLKASYTYDAYGNCTVSDSSTNYIANQNPFRYRGYYYDVETGLFWISSRYYNPEWGRWISPDDIEYLDPESVNGLNLYCYCGNDPVNRYDVNGHFWEYALDAVFVAMGIEDFIKDPSWGKGLLLALDIGLAILPFIPAISSARHLGKIDNVIDAASALNKIDNVGDVASGFRYADDVIDSGQEFGTYLLKNAKGEVIYVGKGSQRRMMQSYDFKKASSWLYYPAKNADIALANEAYFMSIYGGAQSMNAGTRLLNKINSPGLRRLFWWF